MIRFVGGAAQACAHAVCFAVQHRFDRVVDAAEVRRLDLHEVRRDGLRAESGAYGLLVESPMIAATQREQIEKFRGLRDLLKKKGIDVSLIADEWCNTLADIKLFSEAGAADFVQIKTPDLGSIHNTIEAVLYCKAHGMGACLGGTANETDHSTRISTHMGLACQPDFMLSKPGLGADEALMIQTNEMARTLAILQTRR